MLKAAIFDLDGVITDTAKYHFLAWKEIANQLDFNLTEQDNEKLKGVNRIASLDLIVSWAGKSISDGEKELFLQSKNAHYLELIKHIGPDEILPGVIDLLLDLKLNSVKIALGSSSKNAVAILENLQILQWFDAIADGNNTVQGKPHPEVFLNAAKMLDIEAQHCLVFEDAPAGVAAAKSAAMKCVGIGSALELAKADLITENLLDLNFTNLNQKLFK